MWRQNTYITPYNNADTKSELWYGAHVISNRKFCWKLNAEKFGSFKINKALVRPLRSLQSYTPHMSTNKILPRTTLHFLPTKLLVILSALFRNRGKKGWNTGKTIREHGVHLWQGRQSAEQHLSRRHCSERFFIFFFFMLSCCFL